MKKLVVFFVVFILVATSGFAQVSNDANRLIGTWHGEFQGRSMTLTFSSNGTGTYQEGNGGERTNFNFGVSGSKIKFSSVFNGEWELYFSPNNNLLVLKRIDRGDEFWFNKR